MNNQKRKDYAGFISSSLRISATILQYLLNLRKVKLPNTKQRACYNFVMKKIDFLAIGDIVVDAFINIKDAHVHCKIDTLACEICLRFGDKVPYEFVEVVKAVGNSSNAAVSASRLGIETAFIANVGDDQNGADFI